MIAGHSMKLLRRPLLLLTLLLLAGCGGGGGGSAAPPAKSWTILVYMDGDNNLSAGATANFAQIRAAAASPHVRVVVQLATLGETTRRYLVENGQTSQLADLGRVDMAAEETITAFLSWAKDAYPADRTVLILWDHGDGWDQSLQGDSAAKPAPAKTAHAMFTHPGSNTVVLPNHRIRQAIAAAGIKLDVLGFDGCNMSTIEALYEFRALAGVLIASEELISDAGWTYQQLLSGLAAAPGMTAEEFGRLAVTTYRNYYDLLPAPQRFATLAALRSSGLAAVVAETDRIAGLLLDRLADPLTREATVSLIQKARAEAQIIDPFSSGFVYVDMLDLVQRFGLATTLPGLQAAATIAEYHGSARPDAHGISIVFFDLPDAITYNVYNPNYTDYDPLTLTGNNGAFINSYRWDELLHGYYAAAGLL